MPTSAAAGLRFREVGGVAVYVEDHVTGGVLYRGIGVRGGVVEYSEGVGVCFLCAFCLLRIDGSKGGENGGVDHN